jgi:large subunit ribosomal protein L6
MVQLGSAGQCIRRFSTTPHRCSNVGKKRLSIPIGVTLEVTPAPAPIRTKYLKPSPRHHLLGGPEIRESDFQTITVVGPLGVLAVPVPPFISLVPAWTCDARLLAKIEATEALGKVASERNDLVVVVTEEKARKQREMWGTVRALLSGSIEGVSKGHRTTITLKGVGYRGQLIDGGKTLELRVGYNHSVNTPIPEGIEITMTNPTLFEVKSINKHKLGLFCADVRRSRPPEPYKGKVFQLVMCLDS